MEDADIDENEMSLTLLYADGKDRDGVGDKLEVGGINVERHRLLPNVLFDHGKQIVLPIALAEDPKTGMYCNLIDVPSQKASVRAFFYQGPESLKKKISTTDSLVVESKDIDVEVKSLLSDRGREYEHAIFCNQIFDLAAKRFLRGGSIGYQVVRAEQLQPDYQRGIPAGLHLLNTLMLEASLVTMPANKNTVTKKGFDFARAETAREILCLPNVCGKPLSPYLVKSLTSCVGGHCTKVISGYEGKSMVSEKKSTGEIVGSLNWLREEQREIEHKSTELPLRNLPETKIVPSIWKPGKGAKIKALKQKYSQRRAKAKIIDKFPVVREQVEEVGVQHAKAMSYLNVISGGALVPSAKQVCCSGCAEGKSCKKELNVKSKSKQRIPRIPREDKQEVKPPKDKRTRLFVSNTGNVMPKNTKGIGSVAGTAIGSAVGGPVGGMVGGAIGGGIESVVSSGDDKEMKKKVKGVHGVGVGANARPITQKQTNVPSTREGEPPASPHNPYEQARGVNRYTNLGTYKAPRYSAIPPGSKSLSLRKKYKKLKTLRRKVKGRGREGIMTVKVREKDYPAARDFAESKGIKCSHMGIGEDGLVKLRLSGYDSNGMDDIAREHGVAMRVLGGKKKSLPAQVLTDYPSTLDSRELDSIGGLDNQKLAVRKKIYEDRDLRRGGGGVRTVKNIENSKTKSANVESKKNISEEIKNMKSETKALPGDDYPDLDTPEVGTDLGTEDKIEKYSAQVLRRLHRDNILLLEQYDEIAELLEHDDIGGHLQRKLESLAAELDEIEGLMETHHPEATPLEGAGVRDEGLNEIEEGAEDIGEGAEELAETPEELEAAEEIGEGAKEMAEGMEEEEVEKPNIPEDLEPAEVADSEENEVPDPDDVIKGMETKELRRRLVKALRNQYGKKMRTLGVGEEVGDEAEDQEEDDDPVVDLKKREKNDGATGVKAFHKDLCPDCGKDPCICGKVKDLDVTETTLEENREVPDSTEMNPIIKQVEKDFEKFKPHEVNALKEASKFLKDTSGDKNWDRMKERESYRLGKDLEKMGIKADKSFAIEHVKHMEEEKEDEEHSIAHYKKIVHAAAQFLNKLADAMDFGEPHRQEALTHHLALEDVLGAIDPMLDEIEEIEVISDEVPDEVGEVGEKGTSLVEDPDTKYPEMCKEVSEVDVTAPKGWKPGLNKENAQKFGKPAEDIPSGVKGASLVKKPKTSFPEANKEESEVEVTRPKSPTKAKLGNEPAQKFGKPAEDTKGSGANNSKSKSSLVESPGTSFPEADKLLKEQGVNKPSAYKTTLNDEKGQKFGKKAEKSFDTGLLRQQFLRQGEQMTEIDKQIKELAKVLVGSNGKV